MRRVMIVVALMATVSLGVSSVSAEPACCKKKAAKAAKAAAQASFPKIVRMVGDKEIGCPTEAAKVARDSGGSVVFVVGDDKFKSEEKAWFALADASEDFVNKYVAIACVKDGQVKYCEDKCPSQAKAAGAKGSSCCKSGSKADEGCCKEKRTKGSTCGKGNSKTAKASAGSGCGKRDSKTAKGSAGSGCSKSGAKLASSDCDIEKCKDMKGMKFRVAGTMYDDWDKALAAHTKVTSVVKKISMTYVVDGTKVGCSTQVCPKAKAAGKVKYVVGDQELECELLARTRLAKAQYEAAKKVISKTLARL